MSDCLSSLSMGGLNSCERGIKKDEPHVACDSPVSNWSTPPVAQWVHLFWFGGCSWIRWGCGKCRRKGCARRLTKLSLFSLELPSGADAAHGECRSPNMQVTTNIIIIIITYVRENNFNLFFFFSIFLTIWGGSPYFFFFFSVHNESRQSRNFSLSVSVFVCITILTITKKTRQHNLFVLVSIDVYISKPTNFY